MTNILTTALLSAFTVTYQPDVRTAYFSRGRVAEDRPIQSNMLRLDVSLDEWGSAGLWHWHYNSLTDRLRDKRDCQFTELDWGAVYNYDWEIAEGWTLANEFMVRWFTMLFYHEPYKESAEKSILEYYYSLSLNNAYLTPVAVFRRGFHGQDYLNTRFGVKKPMESDFFGLIEGLSVTPAFYVDFGNNRMRSIRYGKTRPDGSDWGGGVMNVLGELQVSYPINTHFSLFSKLQQFCIVDHDAREVLHAPHRRDLTILTAGMTVKF